jgi:hypothetical protein
MQFFMEQRYSLSEDGRHIDYNSSSSPSARKITLVDTLGNVTCSLVIGSGLDCASGLDFKGVAASRATATAMNSVTGGPYGWWREKAFKLTRTNEKSGRVRKTLADLLAFNTFQVPIYGVAVATGSLFSEGEVNFDKVQSGMTYLAMISPLISPVMGLFMDGARRIFGINTASKGAYSRNLTHQ